MPELGYKPVNKYLPPRPRRSGAGEVARSPAEAVDGAALPSVLRWLDRVLPLGVIEASHVTGSVAGAVLLLLSQGLSRRLDAAYYLTIATVAAGVVASLLKGFDYEEALLLIGLVVVLRLARPAFNRKAAFFATRFSTSWIAAVAAALVASVWLGLFAFKHVEYSQDLWWQFELEGNASRFLRGSVGAATVVLLVEALRAVLPLLTAAHGAAEYEIALFGLLLMAFMLFRPSGLAGLAPRAS